MNINIIILFCLINLNICSNSYETAPPKNLKNIKNIYTSSFNINLLKPVITHSNVYYIADRILQAFNYAKLDKKFKLPIAKPVKPYGNSFINPLLQDSAVTHFFAFFFNKDCTLRLYIEDDKHVEKACEDLKFEMNFNKLENNDNCYDSLRIYYDHATYYMAVYNTNSNKIIVFDLYDAYMNNNKESVIEAQMKGKIKQAFIYSRGETNKWESVLIGIDEYGQVNFWNLKNYCNFISSMWNYAFNDNLIKSFETQKFYPFPNQDIASFIKKKTILYINNDNFHLYDLDKLAHINSQNNLITDVSALLGLKDGNALVGTTNGYLYLITLEDNSITILDKIQLCDDRIYFLSSVENCKGGTNLCYRIAANCKKLKIFEIKA